MALIFRRLEIVILACRVLSRELFGGWPHFLNVLRSGFLFSGRLRFYSVWTVKAGVVNVHFFVHRAIDKGVVNDGGVHMRHSGVVKERVSPPVAAPVAGTEVAKAVVDAAVKADSRTPVARIKRVNAIVPSPP